MPSLTRSQPSLQPHDIAEIMARLATGDPSAVLDLVDGHGHRIAAEVRRQLRVCGVHRVDRDDLAGLVLDVALDLADLAGAWRPDGALPWIWARGRVLAVAKRFVGVHADEIDAERQGAEPAPAAAEDEPVEVTFERLLRVVPQVQLLARACAEAQVPEPAMYCLLEYRIQQDQGDPSPAHTLAARYGIRPEALRQRVSRCRRRLRQLAATDPRFADLEELVLVA